MRSKKNRGNATLIGSGNTVTGACSGIAGGETNQILNGSDHGFIGGGFNNRIDVNTLASAIAGGQGNTVAPGAACGFIGGGFNNTVSSSGNAILGGVNNNDTALPGVMIAGNNINAASGPLIPNALHVNGLWANGLPIYPMVPPITNQVFKVPVGGPIPAGAFMLMII